MTGQGKPLNFLNEKTDLEKTAPTTVKIITNIVLVDFIPSELEMQNM